MRAVEQKSNKRPVPPGLAARNLAVHLVAGVLIDKQPLELVLAAQSARPQVAAMEARDRALARAVAATVLRRQGELEHVLAAFLERPLPADKGRLWPILLTGAAQLVCLDMPAHAVVDLSVEVTRRDRGAHRFAKLVNAVLRRVAERGAGLLADQDRTRLNVPDWLWQRWSTAYGPDVARRIAEASLAEAALDISVKDGPGRSRERGRVGGAARRAGCCRPARSGLPPTAASRTCPATPRARGGCRTRPRRWWRVSPATSPARRWPICARRRAARPPAWLPPAPRSRPSTSRPRASIACARTWPACSSPPRWWRPMRRAGRRGAPSTSSCSMRPARRPAPSAAIPTSCA